MSRVSEVPEAPLERTEYGLDPAGDGWFVLNAREARWFENEHGSYAPLEGEHHRFPQLGVNVSVLEPGQPACMYHREDAQEDFLVVAGDGILVIEGEERPLRAWDLVHCPAWTTHVIVGTGERGCVLVSVGKRPTSAVVYPPDEAARAHAACVEAETTKPSEAYARFAPPRERGYRDADLPD